MYSIPGSSHLRSTDKYISEFPDKLQIFTVIYPHIRTTQSEKYLLPFNQSNGTVRILLFIIISSSHISGFKGFTCHTFSIDRSQYIRMYFSLKIHPIDIRNSVFIFCYIPSPSKTGHNIQYRFPVSTYSCFFIFRLQDQHIFPGRLSDQKIQFQRLTDRIALDRPGHITLRIKIP